MEKPSSSFSEPRVPGPHVQHRIPPPSTGKAAIPAKPQSRSGVSVPVYPKLPNRSTARSTRQTSGVSPLGLTFDAITALVSIAFCLLFFSEL